MKGLYYMFGVFILLMIVGCSIFTHHEFDLNKQALRFSNAYRPVEDGRLRTDGYYCLDKKLANHNFILYPDGTFLKFIFKDDFKEFIGKSIVDIDRLIKISATCKYGGIYKILGDTLLIDCYNSHIGTAMNLFKDYYIIVDSVTLLDPEWDYYYRFVPAEGLPSPFEVLVKERKFMWYDEEEWLLYRQQLKEYLDRKAADAALKSETPNR